MTSPVLFSSKSHEWETPQLIFDKLHRIFNFRLGVSATAQNAKCKTYFSKKQCGLKQDWHPYHRVWMSPPYGTELGKWVKKAYEESRKGCCVVCLFPARTDTRWWHEWVQGKGIVIFIKQRLRFGDAKNDAPFPSVLVIYGLDA